MSRDDLHLHERILLLALEDEKGTASGFYGLALGGAILAELLLQGRITTEPGKRGPLVTLADTRMTGEPVLDEALEAIRTASRRASPQAWVGKLSNAKDLKHRIARRLCQRGILRATEEKVLLFFTSRRYPEVDPEPERRMIEEMRRVILSDDGDVPPRTAILVGLAAAADLLDRVVDKKERKARRQRIEALRDGTVSGEAVQGAVQAVQAALIAVMAANVAAMAATSSS